jgi:hypothetical protein
MRPQFSLGSLIFGVASAALICGPIAPMYRQPGWLIAWLCWAMGVMGGLLWGHSMHHLILLVKESSPLSSPLLPDSWR